MSQYLDNMEIGDFIDVRGPNGLLVYQKRGWCFRHGDCISISFSHFKYLCIAQTKII